MLAQTDINTYYKQLGTFNNISYQLSPTANLLIALKKHGQNTQSAPSHMPRQISFESHKQAMLLDLKSQFSSQMSIEELKKLYAAAPPALPLWTVYMSTNYQGLTLHWGVMMQKRLEWKEASKQEWPEGSTPFGDGKAVQTAFQKDTIFDGYWSIEINISEETITGVNFVLVDKQKNVWFNNNSQNYSIPFVQRMLRSKSLMPQVTMELIIEQIVEAEMHYGSWTLMHRFNKCAEFLNQIDIQKPSDLYN